MKQLLNIKIPLGYKCIGWGVNGDIPNDSYVFDLNNDEIKYLKDNPKPFTNIIINKLDYNIVVEYYGGSYRYLESKIPIDFGTELIKELNFKITNEKIHIIIRDYII